MNRPLKMVHSYAGSNGAYGIAESGFSSLTYPLLPHIHTRPMVKPQCPTYAVPVGFPVFGLAFTTTNQLLVGGGGGAGRSGIQNKLASEFTLYCHVCH